MSLLPKNSVNLPPLIVNGEPKVLHKMPLKDIHTCLLSAMRRCYKSRTMFIFANTNEIVPWWPKDKLPWSLNFKNFVPINERRVLYVHLLTSCYMYYGQLDTLHLFDCKSNESPKWTLCEENNEYKLISQTSHRVLAKIPSHEVLSFIALQTRQNELSQMTKEKQYSVGTGVKKSTTIGFKRLSSSYKVEYCKKRVINSGSPLGLVTDVSVTLTPLEICTDNDILQHQRRNSVSIMGPLSAPRRSSDADAGSLSDVEQSPCDWLTCPLCSFARFSCNEYLLHHMILCKAQSKKQTAKDVYMFQLGLVPAQTRQAYDKVVEQTPQPTFSVNNHNLDVKLLASKLPVSSLLSQKILSQIKPGGKYSFFDSKNYQKSRANGGTSNHHRIFPIVYKPPTLPVHYHTYSFTNAERKNHAKFLENGGLNEEARTLLKSCKLCSVDVERLSETSLKKQYGITIVQKSTRPIRRRVVVPPKIYDNSTFVKQRTNQLQKRTTLRKTVGDSKILNKYRNIKANGDRRERLFVVKRIAGQPWFKSTKVELTKSIIKRSPVKNDAKSATDQTKIVSPKKATTKTSREPKNGMFDGNLIDNAFSYSIASAKSASMKRRTPSILRAPYGRSAGDVAREETVRTTANVGGQCSPNVASKDKILLKGRTVDGKVRTVCVRLDKSIVVPPGVRINGETKSPATTAVANYSSPSSSSASSRDIAKTKVDSILFKCHLCEKEILFHNGSFRSVESHMNSLHKGIACFYTQNEHTSPNSSKDRVIMMEAFKIKR